MTHEEKEFPGRGMKRKSFHRRVVAKGERDGGGMEWEFGISRCKLTYVEWINNKVLRYSTENCIQYPVINHNGKEYEKECIYMSN